MAKGKSIPYVWFCQHTSDDEHRTHINGSGWAQREKVKDMKRPKYCPKIRKMSAHLAKPVKKGGTKALVNMK